MIKARDALENRLFEQQDEQSKIHQLDQRLTEQSHRIMELESVNLSVAYFKCKLLTLYFVI